MKKIPVRNINATRVPSPGKFTIRRLGDILGGHDLHHELHRHNFYFLLAVETGKGQHDIDFAPHPVQDRSVFLLRPGQVHQLELKAGSTGFLVEFDNAFYQPKEKASAQRFRKAMARNCCRPEKNRFGKLNALLENMFAEYTDRPDAWQDAIRAGLELFFIGLVRQSSNPGVTSTAAGSYAMGRFEEFMELLEKHIATHKQVSRYTDLMNLSAYQLNEITKAAVGKTVSDLVNEQVILEAKRFLLATANQVKDVADLLGYEDTSYFIRFFKRHTGQSPETFRKHFT